MFKVQIPPTRHDSMHLYIVIHTYTSIQPSNCILVLHECDVAEDMALAYGYNNIQTRMPSSHTIAQPSPMNKLSDQLVPEIWALKFVFVVFKRHLICESGWTEVLTFTLCSTDDVSRKLRKPDHLEALVKISNPKTTDFQANLELS